jgi:hypothetical protein
MGGHTTATGFSHYVHTSDAAIDAALGRREEERPHAALWAHVADTGPVALGAGSPEILAIPEDCAVGSRHLGFGRNKGSPPLPASLFNLLMTHGWRLSPEDVERLGGEVEYHDGGAGGGAGVHAPRIFSVTRYPVGYPAPFDRGGAPFRSFRDFACFSATLFFYEGGARCGEVLSLRAGGVCDVKTGAFFKVVDLSVKQPASSIATDARGAAAEVSYHASLDAHCKIIFDRNVEANLASAARARRAEAALDEARAAESGLHRSSFVLSPAARASRDESDLAKATNQALDVAARARVQLRSSGPVPDLLAAIKSFLPASAATSFDEPRARLSWAPIDDANIIGLYVAFNGANPTVGVTNLWSLIGQHARMAKLLPAARLASDTLGVMLKDRFRVLGIASMSSKGITDLHESKKAEAARLSNADTHVVRAERIAMAAEYPWACFSGERVATGGGAAGGASSWTDTASPPRPASAAPLVAFGGAGGGASSGVATDTAPSRASAAISARAPPPFSPLRGGGGASPSGATASFSPLRAPVRSSAGPAFHSQTTFSCVLCGAAGFASLSDLLDHSRSVHVPRQPRSLLHPGVSDDDIEAEEEAEGDAEEEEAEEEVSVAGDLTIGAARFGGGSIFDPPAYRTLGVAAAAAASTVLYPWALPSSAPVASSLLSSSAAPAPARRSPARSVPAPAAPSQASSDYRGVSVAMLGRQARGRVTTLCPDLDDGESVRSGHADEYQPSDPAYMRTLLAAQQVADRVGPPRRLRPSASPTPSSSPPSSSELFFPYTSRFRAGYVPPAAPTDLYTVRVAGPVAVPAVAGRVDRVGRDPTCSNPDGAFLRRH